MEDVYLTYNDDIVFLSGTPASVGMDSIGTHKMGMCSIHSKQTKSLI